MMKDRSSEAGTGAVSLAIEGAVAIVTLERPEKLNALTPAMLESLTRCLTDAEAHPGCRAIVLAGAGKVFCAGADVRLWSALGAEDFRKDWIGLGHRAFDAVAGCRLPVIAAMHGLAFGGGLELALAADIRIAAAGTTFGLPEVSLGTVPGWGGTKRLATIIGIARAKHMVLTAHRLDSATALDWGLVTEVTAEGAVLGRARAIAETMAGLAPIAVQLAKSVIDAAAGHDTGRTLDILSGMATVTTEDAREGTAAMLEKRPPVFRER